jgi:hypothetical protein
MNTATTKPAHTIEIYGVSYHIEVGTPIQPEEWGLCGSRLEVSDWDQAEFRLPSLSYPDYSIAVNVRITGRTFQRRPYSDMRWVKVEIEFVGDGEPSTFTAGWVAPRRS